jgi:hypothetical protein
MEKLAKAFLNVVLFGGMFLSTFVGGVMAGGTYIKIAEEAPGIGAQVAALAMADTSTADRPKPKSENVMMKEKMGSSTPGVRAMGVPACLQLVLKATLKRGSVGEEVSKLQAQLITEGYLASTSPLGYFGPLTEKAVAKWQFAQGIASSSEPNTNTGAGMVGPRTRALFQKCENRIEQRKDMLMNKMEGMPPGKDMGSSTMPKPPKPPKPPVGTSTPTTTNTQI